MLPQIVAHARVCFRHLKPEARSEAIQEVVCNALKAFVRLVQLGKADIAYPSPLARYAVAQVRDGRKVGCKLNVLDISSTYCQAGKGVVMERLDKYDAEEECWQEILIEDKTVSPAELAASRIDFPSWLAMLKRRDRRIAEFLALGNRTSEAAKKFNVSEGRVSQLRRELAASWRNYIGEQPAPAAA